MINIYEPSIEKYSKSAIDAIQSGWISNHGKYVEESTKKLTELLGCKYSILMANGTCATHCLFLSIQYKYPQINRIYVPNNAYIAAWNSMLMCYNISNLSVMKMDIGTWNINTDEEYIKTLDTNSAVLIVHNLGNIINVPRLKRLRPDLIFVEDNCEGLFGKYEGIYSGTSDDILCSSISFYGNKVITTGEGGAFLTNHKDIYEHIKKVYSQGMSDTRYLHDVHAYNYRMSNVQAAFLYDQLNDIETILTIKRQVFYNYDQLFQPLITDNKIALFKKEENTECANWIYAIRIIENKRSISETTEFFKSAGIDIRPFFYPINHHGHLSMIENTDEISYVLNKEIIMIPSSPTICFEEQQTVVNSVYKFILFNQNIRVVKIDKENSKLLDDFIPTINSKYFRYFNKRTSQCIKDHLHTFLFYDMSRDIYFGYTHIDFYEKYWLGIYIHDNYRNKKLGNLLLDYTLNCSKLNNITDVHLSVDSDNEVAIRLYKKNNFIVNDVIGNITYMNKTL